MIRIAAILSLSLSACAQAESELARIQALKLPFADGQVQAFYSPGAKVRAERYRAALEMAHRWCETQLGVRVPVTLAVLDKQDWERASSVPYPMPNSKPGLVTVPARMEDFPGFADMRVDAGILTETITFHEMGHLFAGEKHIGSVNPWVNELVANIFAQAYIGAHQPDMMSYVSPSAANTLTPRYTSLADLDYLYTAVPFSNYAWFQFQLNRLASFVAQKRDLRKLVGQLKMAFPAEDRDYLPLQEVISRIERIAPGFTDELGPLSGPSTIKRTVPSTCRKLVLPVDVLTVLVIENATSDEIVVSQPGKNSIHVAAGKWRRLNTQVGEQVEIPGGKCLTASNEPTLAMIERP